MSAVSGLAPALRAVTVIPDRVANRGVFGVEIGSETQFYARADRVLSVSFQEYRTDAGLVVSEVVVDMENSSQQIRLYSVRPPSSADLSAAAGAAGEAAGSLRGVAGPAAPAAPALVAKAQEKADSALERLPAMPVKSYPMATHARTVEYVVRSRAELLAFYRNFRDLFSGKEIAAGEGASVDGRNTAFGSAGQTSSKLTVNRLGGTVFIVKP